MVKIAESKSLIFHRFRKSRRVLCGLTQEDVASLIGRSVYQVHCIEKGLCDPLPDEARIIARALQCDVDELFPDIAKQQAPDA